MAPGRVLALSPEGSKRLLTPDDEPVVARLTRQKVREDVDKSMLHKVQGPLQLMMSWPPWKKEAGCAWTSAPLHLLWSAIMAMS